MHFPRVGAFRARRLIHPTELPWWRRSLPDRALLINSPAPGVDDPPLITVWLQVRVLPGPLAENFRAQALEIGGRAVSDGRGPVAKGAVARPPGARSQRA